MCYMVSKLPWNFYLLMEKFLGNYFHFWSLITLGITVQPENTYSCILKET